MKIRRVIVTPNAKANLRAYVAYLRNEKKNPQSAANVLNDFRETKKHLERNADTIEEPESSRLQTMGLRRANFVEGHRYFVLFKIEPDGKVYITNVFHMLEDFESKLV